MSLVDDFRLIRWKETLWYNALRSAAAAIVWTGLTAWADDGQFVAQHGGPVGIWLQMPLALFIGLIPMTLLFRVLGYIPIVGLFFLLFAIVLMGAGDPLVFALHRAKPEWVPVDNPSLFSLSGFIIVTSPYREF